MRLIRPPILLPAGRESAVFMLTQSYSLEDIAEANGFGLDRVQAFAENA